MSTKTLPYDNDQPASFRKITKNLTQKLKSEYQVKSRHLAELKEEIITIKKEMHRSLGQEGSTQYQIRSGVASLAEAVEWRKRLHLLTTRLLNIHLDDSAEQRSLKKLQRYIQLSLMTGPTLDTEVNEMVAIVADLNLLHENLCGVKEEIENDINTALRALAKAHLQLQRQAEHDPSIDGDSTDYMTHFVKQHVNLRRRKVPFRDLTNRIVSSDPQHRDGISKSSTRSVISNIESPDISTYSGLSGIDANTGRLNGSTLSKHR
ncbi:uncharacterized protein LOC117343312 [Pecten maximus]|uniref:uncharacterized protein LOC117343312 n=1 Tax=Pecten maximus TaxID=6579 RepID=UPI001458E0A5|nr:uncharacterized protein LOC117343312 [Pecten maximus]